jgi:Flp pilus assembly protein TadD
LRKAALRGFVLALLFFGIAAVLSAWGRKEKKNDAEQNNVMPNTSLSAAEQNIPVRITGRVRLVGNEPFTELVITAQERDYFIEKDEEYKLKELQQRMVTVEGIQTVISLLWASGLPAGNRYSLKDIRILRIE